MKKMIPVLSVIAFALLPGCATTNEQTWGSSAGLRTFIDERNSLVERAQSGDAAAQMKLSSIYANGYGKKGNNYVDLPQSVEWLRKSADNGFMTAFAELSVRSAFGSFGVKKNTDDARLYAGRALTVYNNESKQYSVRELFILNLALTGAGEAEFKVGDKAVAAKYLCTAAKIDPSNAQTHKVLVNTDLTCS